MRSEDQYLETVGARLRFRDVGDGAPVVLIHGWALDLEMWDPQFAALASEFRLIAHDRRGFGLSSGEPDLAQDAIDLERLLDALGVERAALVGMSQGARVALRCALRCPDRVSCLVLDGPPSEEPVQDDASGEEVPITHYRKVVRRLGMNAFREEWLRHPFLRLRTPVASMQELLERIVARYPGNDLRTTSESTPSLIQASLPSVHVPALVLNGEHDSVRRRASGAALARALPLAQYAHVPASGHLPNLDNPVAYDQLLTGFLRALSSVPAQATARSAC